jgi:hypothetical protein
MARTEHEPRRFITRHDVEDAAAAGRPVVVRGRDVLTDEAAQRAMDLGVSVEREGAGRAPGGSAGSRAATAAPAAPAAPASSEQLRRAVRAAVVAELGREPAGLDEAIDRVLRRR